MFGIAKPDSHKPQSHQEGRNKHYTLIAKRLQVFFFPLSVRFDKSVQATLCSKSFKAGGKRKEKVMVVWSLEEFEGVNEKKKMRRRAKRGWRASKQDRGFGKERQEGKRWDGSSLSETNWQGVQSKQKCLHLKACGVMDAQDKSTCFTVCLHKTQILSASKTRLSPGAQEQGFAPQGFTELVLWIDHKNSISKGLRNYEAFLFSQTLTKQTPT